MPGGVRIASAASGARAPPGTKVSAAEPCLDGGPDALVFPSTRATPRSPSRVRDQLREAQASIGTTVTPHDFRRTVATQVANSTTIGNATALLGHADEGTTVRHYVKRTHVAPDLRVVLDQLVQQAATDDLPGKTE